MSASKKIEVPAITIVDLLVSAEEDPAWGAAVKSYWAAKSEYDEKTRLFNDAEMRLAAAVTTRPIPAALRQEHVGNTQQQLDRASNVWSDALSAVSAYPVTSLAMLVAKASILAREYSDDFGNGSEGRDIVADIFRLAGLPSPFKSADRRQPAVAEPNSGLPADWRDAFPLYLKLKQASDDTPLGTPGEDEIVLAYSAARDHLIENVAAPSVASLALKLRLLAEEAVDGVVSSRALLALAEDADRLGGTQLNADIDHYGTSARWIELMRLIAAQRLSISAAIDEPKIDLLSDGLARLQDQAVRLPAPGLGALLWKVEHLLEEAGVGASCVATIRADFLRFGATASASPYEQGGR